MREYTSRLDKKPLPFHAGWLKTGSASMIILLLASAKKLLTKFADNE
jgi:hypothetical protein